MQEEWKDIKDYEGKYQVSNLGRVKSLVRDIILKPHFNNKRGYYTVKLSDLNNKRLDKHIHLLVFDTFICVDRKYKVVDHLDENKLNNQLDNLDLKTQQDNMEKHFLVSGKKTSKYPGVSWLPKDRKWRVYGKNKKYLGRYNSEEAAYEVYKKYKTLQ